MKSFILGIETTVCRNSIGFKPLAKTVCKNFIGFKPLAKTVCKKTIGGAHFAQTVCKESLVLTARAQGHAKNVWFSAQRHARGDMQEMFGLARNGPPHESKPNDLFRVRFVHRAVGACEA